MTGVEATAPGKVVLLGEYAVLDGAPALSLAVDRRAYVTIESCEPSDCRVAAPQLGIDPVAFGVGAGGQIRWHDQREDWSLFERTAGMIEDLVEHAARRFSDPGAFRLRIDTSELYIATEHGPVKLGLGSSGAVAVALDAAITRFVGGHGVDQSPRRVLARLLAPYRKTQGGHGSGIDLATSLFGGLIGYRLDSSGGRQGAPVDHDAVQVQSLSLPNEFECLFVWTGEAASTTDLVSEYRRWSERDPDGSDRLREQMNTVCAAGRTAVEQGDARALVEYIGAYGAIMGTMESLVKAPVVSAPHRKAMALADGLDAAYKPCGAGGGDMGMAASTDAAVIERLAGELDRAGLKVLALSVDPQGVCSSVHEAGAF